MPLQVPIQQNVVERFPKITENDNVTSLESFCNSLPSQDIQLHSNNIMVHNNFSKIIIRKLINIFQAQKGKPNN